MLPSGASIKTCLCGVSLWFALGISVSIGQEASAPQAAGATEEIKTDPALDRVRQLLAPIQPTLINDDVFADLATAELSISINLSEKRLRLFAGDKEALSCPIASGFASRATRRGEFKVVAVEEDRKLPDRGAYVRGKGDGEVVVADIDRRWDPMPPGTRFVAVPVALLIKLEGEGPMIQSGLPTGAGTTSGDVRIPVSAASVLAEHLKKGAKVEIK